MSTSTAPDQASETQGTNGSGAEHARKVAGVAGQEAKHVARDVKEQARGLLAETTNQMEDQSRTQRDRLVETLRSFSDDLEEMTQQHQGLAADAAREVSQRARTVSQRLDGREPRELLDDLRSFARRRPVMFLAGAAISGVVVGRFLRGTRDAAEHRSDTSPGTIDVAQTQERPGAQFDPTVSATPTGETPSAPGDDAGTTASAPVDPAVGTAPAPVPSGRPVEGP
jgi:hypothetical protein